MSNPPPLDGTSATPGPPEPARLVRATPRPASPGPILDRETPITPALDATLDAAASAALGALAPAREVTGEFWPAHLAIPADQPWCPELLAPHLPWSGDAVSDPLVGVTWTGPKAWRSAGVSMRGSRQAAERMHREESIAVLGDADTLILCLADGASSSRWARIAAEFVCRTVPGTVLRELDDDPDAASDADAGNLGRAVGRAIGLATGQAWHGLRALAADSRSSPADFRTTLLLAVLRRSRAGRYWFINGIGDGTAIVQEPDGTIRPALPPAGPDDRGDAGCRLPDADSADRATRIRVLPAHEVDVLLLLSAGAAPLTGYPSVTPQLDPGEGILALRRWLMPVVDELPAASQSSDDDDRSVLVAWRSVNGLIERR